MSFKHDAKFIDFSSIALIILAVIPTVPTETWERIATIPAELAGKGTMTERKEIWAAGLRAFPQHPLLGVGAGAFGKAVESQQTTRFSSTINPHNTMVGLLVEHGVIGLLPFVALLTIFALSCFVGYYVVWQVTPALHSPLMAVTNAVSSVIIVGALLAAGLKGLGAAQLFGFIAVALAAVNIFGGFIVTHRMLSMFKKKPVKK